MKTAVEKGGKKLGHMMTDVNVSHVSLVDKGANKKKFAIFKSAEAAQEGSEGDDTETTLIKKYGYPDDNVVGGSDFSAALQAIRTSEELSKSQCALDDYFFILKCVMKGVLRDENVKDKSAGLKKAIEQFRDETTKLFSGLPVQKAAELIEGEGGEMQTNTNSGTPEQQALAKAKGQGAGGVSANPEPDAQNRTSESTTVEGIGKGKSGLKKEDIQTLIDVRKAKMKELAMDDKKKMSDKKADMKKCQDEIEAFENEIEAIEKAVGDGSPGAPATGKDTVSSNGDAATTAPDHVAKTEGQPAPAATPAAPAPVKKDEVGTDATPTHEGAKTLGTVNETDGAIAKAIASLESKIDVMLDGKLSGVTSLVKEQGERLSKIEKGHEAIEKASGVSNSAGWDFSNDNSDETKKVKKSDEEEWSKVTDSFGAIKQPTAGQK